MRILPSKVAAINIVNLSCIFSGDVLCIFISVTSSLSGYQHSFGRGTGFVFLNYVSCTGAESSLLSCRINRVGENYCSRDAGVVCPCKFDVIIKQFV